MISTYELPDNEHLLDQAFETLGRLFFDKVPVNNFTPDDQLLSQPLLEIKSISSTKVPIKNND